MNLLVYTLPGTNLSPPKKVWKVFFLFHQWDMLVSCNVDFSEVRRLALNNVKSL